MRSAKNPRHGIGGPAGRKRHTMVMGCDGTSPRSAAGRIQHRINAAQIRSAHHHLQRRMTATNTDFIPSSRTLPASSKDRKRIGSWFETREDALLQ